MKLANYRLTIRYHSKFLSAVLLGFGILRLCAVDLFELGPIHYSETKADNAVTLLATDKSVQNSGDDLAFLEAVLKKLEIEVSSQTLVFSKTSVQKSLISAQNPRALYFSNNAYVGYVPGGIIEIIVHDPDLGLVFYTAKKRQVGAGIVVERERSCLNCHVSARTQDVPGLFARSLATDADGNPDLKQHSYEVSDETPVENRWGGWYVTGNWQGTSHLGNAVLQRNLTKLADLSKTLKTQKYPAKTSDIAALMVLEHQCKIHNRLVAAKFQYRRTQYLGLAMNEPNNLSNSLDKMAKRLADKIVEDLLFCNEARIGGDGLEGGEKFEKAFTAGAIKSKQGKHLRKLRLYGRLFKYRCSYMIHSEAFLALPKAIQAKVFKELEWVLKAEVVEKKFQHLQASEKSTILEILMETTAMKQYLK